MIFPIYINNLLLDRHNHILKQFFKIMIHLFAVNRISSNSIVDSKDAKTTQCTVCKNFIYAYLCAFMLNLFQQFLLRQYF